MKYWSGKNVLERDLLEGESFFDATHPHPAYKGVRLLDDGKDYLYELEMVPGTDRMESIVDPSTLQAVVGKICDIVLRRWNDDTNTWDEMKMPALLKTLGYDDMPSNKMSRKMSAFDRAMKGV